MNFHKNLMKDIFILVLVLCIISFIKIQIKSTNEITIIDNYNQSPPITNIPCDIFFNIYKYPICLDVPEYIYYSNLVFYDKIKIYFNLRKDINYTKASQCQVDDIILYINKINTNFINYFWIIS
jgi:hypothetical protein